MTLNIPKRFNDSEGNARAKGFRVMMEKFQNKVRHLSERCSITYVHQLPDMDFPINAKAEGRILVPWEHTMYPNTSKQDSSGAVYSSSRNHRLFHSYPVQAELKVC